MIAAFLIAYAVGGTCMATQWALTSAPAFAARAGIRWVLLVLAIVIVAWPAILGVRLQLWIADRRLRRSLRAPYPTGGGR